jgi:LPS-assembly lipoprotein
MLPAGGCGFRPLYGGDSAGSAAPAGAVGQELAAVRVALMPERTGQLLRRALQQRLDPGGLAPAARYDLRVGVSYNAEALGFRRDGTASRVRYIAVARWALFTMDSPPAQVVGGVERALDAYNLLDNQYFASDFSRDAAERRLADLLAEDIVRRLAMSLQARSAG